MTIKTIPELIKFIDEYNISDPDQINELCQNMFGKTFFLLQFGNETRGKEYYLHHLRNVQKDYDTTGTTERFFLNFPHPFLVKDFCSRS